MFNLEEFVGKYVTNRKESMFLKDINANKERLNNKINGKSVLVIGGAGSIGSSFINAIIRFNPKSIVVVDINENGLAELTRSLRSNPLIKVPDDYVTYPMDFASKTFKKMFVKRKGFDIVANFSAHKHVRSEKDIYSVEALINNNVLNARKLLDLLKVYPPEEYFCVSTDKAANPVNIMGASKRIMEDVIFDYSRYFDVKTARFANVAFSNGSLPDGFLKRIAALQPLSAPTDVKRYFVSLEESGQICMLSCMLGNNREIFYPKLREEQMMTFDKIGTNLLKEHGFNVLLCESDEEACIKSLKLKEGSKDYPVHYSGSDTSGEKPYEEFYTEGEEVSEDRFLSLGVITGKTLPDTKKIDKLFDKLNNIFEEEEPKKEEVVKVIGEYLKEFKHIETGKSLDSKM